MPDVASEIVSDGWMSRDIPENIVKALATKYDTYKGYQQLLISSCCINLNFMQSILPPDADLIY